MRQFLTESVLLATLGGILGIGVGYGMMLLLKMMLPPFTLPSAVRVEMDLRVLAFAFAMSILTGLISAWHRRSARPSRTWPAR